MNTPAAICCQSNKAFGFGKGAKRQMRKARKKRNMMMREQGVSSLLREQQNKIRPTSSENKTLSLTSRASLYEKRSLYLENTQA
jgi:hypothetical protein